MHDETKEQYIDRHRREQELANAEENINELPAKEPTRLKQRLAGILFMLLLAVFLWVILQIFGMMKGN